MDILILGGETRYNNLPALAADALDGFLTDGLAVFLPGLSRRNNTRADSQVAGRFSEVFKEA